VKIQYPLALALLTLVLLPLLKRGARSAFIFSSFELLPVNLFSRVIVVGASVLTALVIASLSLGLAGITLTDYKREGIHEGAQIVFIRDCSGSMFGEYFDEQRKFEKIFFATDLMRKFALERPGDAYALIDFGSAMITRSQFIFNKERFIRMSGVICPNLGGTVIDSAIVRAVSLFPEGPSLNAKAIILLTDGGGRMDGADDMARWIKERNINFWYVFIGPESDWLLYKAVPDFVKKLGTLGQQFRGDRPAELEMVMAKIRTLQKGIVKYPEEISEYRLDKFFYGAALAWFSLLGLTVLLEMAVKSGRSSNDD